MVPKSILLLAASLNDAVLPGTGDAKVTGLLPAALVVALGVVTPRRVVGLRPVATTIPVGHVGGPVWVLAGAPFQVGPWATTPRLAFRPVLATQATTAIATPALAFPTTTALLVAATARRRLVGKGVPSLVLVRTQVGPRPKRPSTYATAT